MTPALERLSREDIAEYWDVIEPYLAEAMRRGDAPLSSADLKALALAGQRQIWAAIAGTDLLAVASTGMRRGRDGDVAFVDFCGGRGLEQWLRPCLTELERRAFEAGAIAFEIEEGRLGWQRALPEYRPVRVVLRKDKPHG